MKEFGITIVLSISGIGISIIGFIMPTYIEFINSYKNYILFLGICLTFCPWLFFIFSYIRNKKRNTSSTAKPSGDVHINNPGRKMTEPTEKRPVVIPHLNFPPIDSLTGKDVMRKYGLSHFELKQHIENGLPAYIQNAKGYTTENFRSVTERDLIRLEVWPEPDITIEQWLFKTEDIEKYINTQSRQ